jgi:tRNA G10  N-methylase Trm11
VQLAGEPNGVLLDSCCGSGTILREAQVEGWRPHGLDIDTEAVSIARHNVPDAVIEHGDTRTLRLADASVGACVSNLPFGEQYKVPGDSAEWLRAALGEMARVTEPGSHVVVLCPSIPHQSVPSELVPGERVQIRLLGLKTTIWDYRRV